MIGFINKKYTQKSLSSKVFFDSIVTKLIGNKNIGLHQRQDHIDLILKKIMNIAKQTDIRSYQTELRQALTSGKKDLAASRLKVLVEK